MILGPDWKHDSYASIHADDDEEEDATEHIKEHNKGRELTHEETKDPVGGYAVDDVERQTGAKYKIRHSQTQVPGGIDWLLHAKTCNPDNHAISSYAQQKDDHVDHQQQQTHNLSETRGGGDFKRNLLTYGFWIIVGVVVKTVVIVI